MDVIEDKKIRDGCFLFVLPLTLPKTFTKFRSRENFIHNISFNRMLNLVTALYSIRY